MTDTTDLTIEQHVALARNTDDPAVTVGALRRLLGHGCGPRVFRELAEPLLIDCLDELDRLMKPKKKKVAKKTKKA